MFKFIKKMITEVCGYRDSSGKFHSTKAEAIISDIAFDTWKKEYVPGSSSYNRPKVSEYEALLRGMLRPEYKEMLLDLVSSISDEKTCKPC